MPDGTNSAFCSGAHNDLMPALSCPVQDAFLVVIDVQPTFMAAIHEAERVERRCGFLIQSANLLGVPIIATEQYPTRMGDMATELVELFTPSAYLIPKMSFSCWGSAEFRKATELIGRKTAILVGIETHICVTLTALDLMANGFNVFVCPDAVSARSNEMHKLGMERIRDSGGMPSHSESIVYEWMGTAEHPKFRDVLKIVKEAAR